MGNFVLRRESIEESLAYSVLLTEFEDGAEQRRLKHPNKVIAFKIESPALTKAQMQQYRNHFMSQYGALTYFQFVSPFDNVTYNVRYSPESFITTYSRGYFKCKFEFKVIYP